MERKSGTMLNPVGQSRTLSNAIASDDIAGNACRPGHVTNPRSFV